MYIIFSQSISQSVSQSVSQSIIFPLYTTSFKISPSWVLLLHFPFNKHSLFGFRTSITFLFSPQAVYPSFLYRFISFLLLLSFSHLPSPRYLLSQRPHVSCIFFIGGVVEAVFLNCFMFVCVCVCVCVCGGKNE